MTAVQSMAQRRQAKEWSWASLPAPTPVPVPGGKRGKPGVRMLFVGGGVRGEVFVRGRRARRVRRRGVMGLGSMVVGGLLVGCLVGSGDGLSGWASGGRE